MAQGLGQCTHQDAARLPRRPFHFEPRARRRGVSRRGTAACEHDRSAYCRFAVDEAGALGDRLMDANVTRRGLLQGMGAALSMAAAGCAAPAARIAEDAKADLVLHNGRVYTVDRADRVV